MNEPDFNSLEADLQRLKPAQPSEAFLARLAGSLPPAPTEPAPAAALGWHAAEWWRWLRWLAPAAATVVIAVIGFLLWNAPRPKHASPAPSLAQSVPPPLTADAVEIDQSQVASFDALGHLPDGAPVRFHCREWTDKVVVRDSARGILIEQRTPRLEIVKVSFDTY
ncbi:MAG TPA: hypothetical protein VNZ22_09525 [Bacillota bacterium]|nr:hypothetical protein [Bacillota bacterium]